MTAWDSEDWSPCTSIVVAARAASGAIAARPRNSLGPRAGGAPS
jgi:hypothetical protein